jgi:hypothetical protein
VSRYVILVILNTPLIAAALTSAVVAYKLKHSTRKQFFLRLTLWLGIFLGLIFAESIYVFLFSHQLTQTEPLSLFDVIQITGIIFTLFLANRAFIKADRLERRVHDLHQELSIRLSSISANTRNNK